MPEKIKDVQPPRGLSRLFFRLPIWFFRLHLSWLLMNRFLLLTHTGRKSGLPRKNVLEVLRYDKASSTYHVFSGWAGKADWARNIEKTPEVEITAGGRHFAAYARRVLPEEAERCILDYARRYPIARRVLPRMMGYRVDGSEQDFCEFARLGTVFAFSPLTPDHARKSV